jgi:RNA polymerase sigma-70 factor (ECF subfamily)
LQERLLIRRILAGDVRAEREFYDRHVDRVFRLAYRMAGDMTLAQDFTQETFLRAFDRLTGFRGEAKLGTWLHAIAVSVVLNGLRQVRRLRERETDLDTAMLQGRAPEPVEPHLRERLRQAIDELPEHYRVVFVMYDIEGYTHEEIGAALELPIGTSKARLSRARARLREALAEFAPECTR